MSSIEREESTSMTEHEYNMRTRTAPAAEDGVVAFSFKDPDTLVHRKSGRCTEEYPHHIDKCGEFDRNTDLAAQPTS